MTTVRIPHPFPYQGSKRNIAHHILPHIPLDVERLIEPFCGSAAISIAAAANGTATKFALNDIDNSLMTLWHYILDRPIELGMAYERLWYSQHVDRRAFYVQIRDEFNSTHQPHHFLYLLARMVKGSVRYSNAGAFNQSPDNRRSGMQPLMMRRQLSCVSALLSNRTTLSSGDFRDIISRVSRNDLVYMDPPYQGISFKRDHRYIGGIYFDEFVDVLYFMNQHGQSYLISYDGRTGDKEHGQVLPESLGLTRLQIRAGRSSQATLLGVERETVESLYLSPALKDRLNGDRSAPNPLCYPTEFR